MQANKPNISELLLTTSDSFMRMSEIFEDNDVNMLKEKIKLQDLGRGAVFEIDTLNFDDALETAIKRDTEYYDGKQFEDNLDRLTMTVMDEENVTELRGTPGSTAFETIATRMTNDLIYGSKVKKLVLRPGKGPLVPETALVEVHYTAYYEFGDEPFDSTYLRNQTHKFLLSKGGCVAGLTIGIATMRMHEIAQFLVHPDLGFGKCGVPPRIPANAELLYEVELLNFIDGVEGKPSGDNQGEEETDVLKIANAKQLEGNEHFKTRNYHQAIIKYRKAMSLIDRARQGNPVDETNRMNLMLKLCTNLALCYMRKNNYKHAQQISLRALEIKPNHCKGLFYLGKSLRMLNEYDAAKVQLLKAQKLEPTNQDINKEILQLENAMKNYNAKSKKMSELMLAIPKAGTQADSEDVSEQSKWTRYLTAFVKNGSDRNLCLPTALTPEEMRNLEMDAANLGLIVQTVNDKIIIKKVK